MSRTMMMIALAVLWLGACGKKDEAKKADSKTDTGEAAKSAGGDEKPAAPEKLRLDTIGVTATVPAGSRAAPFNKAVRITAMNVSVDVEVADETFPKTAAEMQESQKILGSDFETITLPDGWALKYKSSGSFLLVTQREIAGKRITCGTNGSSPERVDAALEVCKSLAP